MDTESYQIKRFRVKIVMATRMGVFQTLMMQNKHVKRTAIAMQYMIQIVVVTVCSILVRIWMML